MSTRTNLATDPRGTGTAALVKTGFTEAAGDPLGGQATSRAFTRAAAPVRGQVVTNYSHLKDCYIGTSTGQISSVYTGDVLRVTYTTQGNTSWSDSLGIRVTRRSDTSVSDIVPCVSGDKVYCRASYRANRPRQWRWRMAYVDATGTTVVGVINSAYTATAGDAWLTPPDEVWTVPDDARIVGCVPYIGSGSAGSPSGFITGDWCEIRDVTVTTVQLPAGFTFDGATPDTAPTDTASGWDFAWVGAVNSTASTATELRRFSIGVPASLPANQPVVIRAKVRASAAIAGGRLVLRPDLTTGTGEVSLVTNLALPAGESSITITGTNGATAAAGLALVWGAQAPADAKVELTAWLIEPTAAAPVLTEHPYFDGWTRDVPATATAPGIDYAWTAEPDASTSEAVTTSPVPNETRQAFAAALSTVEGITGYPTAPRTLGRGQAWPVWQARTPLTMASDEVRWLVHVTLPAGLPDATVLEAEELTDWVLVALSSVGVIEQIEPDALISVQDRNAPVPALTVTMTTTT